MTELGQQVEAALRARNGRSLEAYPAEVIRLAEALSRVHGQVQVTQEAHGIHLYMADPGLRVTDGDEKEERSKHLAVNASKYFGLGEWHTLKPWQREKVCHCMKDGRSYRVRELLSMQLSATRNPNARPGGVSFAAANAVMIQDENGNTIPDHPGRVTPILELPEDHPAVWYLRNRGYDLELLWQMFRTSWCEEEAPPIRGQRGYRPLVDGWTNTPQSRVIFYGDIRGVQTIWQGRYLDHHDETRLFVFHPYRRHWVQAAERQDELSPWMWLPPYNALDDRGAWIWKSLAKYYNARGAQRTACGFDSAVRWNAGRRRAARFCVVTEGPLDAGKIGPPAIALVGKFMSPEQATMIASEFSSVLLGYDNDEAGRSQRAKAAAALGAAGVRSYDVFPDPTKNDWGDMTRAECWRVLFPAIAKIT